MNRLNGKTAVITGGATGIGRAAAKRFIEEGARAVKCSVSDEADLDRLYAAAAFLASSDSSFMTASELAVDGGLAQL